MKTMKKISLVILACFTFLAMSGQRLYDKDMYYAFKSSTWKGDAAPELFQIKIDNSPLVQSDVYTDMNGNLLSGKYNIIIHKYKYVEVDLTKGVVDGALTLYSYNQEVSKYLMKQGMYDGEQSEYNGSEVYLFKNGVTIAYSSYHDNKQLKCQISYKNGKQDGEFIVYDKNGKIITTKFLKEGKLEGEVMEDRWNGSIQRSNYVNNELNGKYTKTYADRSMQTEGFYTNGLKDKTWIEFDKNGKKSLETEYTNDKLNGIRKVFEDGELMKSENYKDGKRNGEFLVYENNDGKIQLVKQDNYVDSKLDGISKHYYYGVLDRETVYKNDKIVTRKEFDRVSGLILSEELYKDYNVIGEKRYRQGKLQYLLLEDENGNLNIVKEYSTTGQSIKKTTAYKKGENLKLVEDEWGIIDI